MNDTRKMENSKWKMKLWGGLCFLQMGSWGTYLYPCQLE
jgi:hypothetical protein